MARRWIGGQLGLASRAFLLNFSQRNRESVKSAENTEVGLLQMAWCGLNGSGVLQNSQVSQQFGGHLVQLGGGWAICDTQIHRGI